MRSFGNQWKIQSLYELQYYNCPACHYKNRSNQEFINHAYETHPESIEDLKNITDVSMEGVKYPWDDIDIKAETPSPPSHPTMYDFQNLTDIFIYLSFMPFCTQL